MMCDKTTKDAKWKSEESDDSFKNYSSDFLKQLKYMSDQTTRRYISPQKNPSDELEIIFVDDIIESEFLNTKLPKKDKFQKK